NQTGSTDPNIHIGMILSEAYSDLTDLDKIRYVDKEDPLKTFKAMAAGENSISGHIIVPGFAGGTANTEFNVLTGMQTEMLSDSNATAFRMFSTKQESVLSVLKEEGYKTDFIHPGLDWYYNRKNVYKRLGADNMLFAKDMDDMWTHGAWVADDYVAALIERHFEEAVANGEWLCSMSVTIQNHMSYTRQKYWNQDFDDMDIMATLSNDVYDALGIYSVGVRDANKMLNRLKKYFEKTDEPVMLVFFGDHMPYLGDDRKGYKELGIDYVSSDDQGKQLMMYETPYIIWCNEAGAEAIDFDNKVKSLKLPEDGIIQSSYLGGLVLELSGHSQSSPWFSYLCEARKSLPVTKFASGTNDMLDKLAKWTYYKIKH
ncbi:MAG: LTA synthase family protein, partial [Clostridia bacterium]|nr:LTA synthase family protein [Clostridia bacterium]